MTETLTYKIDTFEGPLDLLLTLIAKNKMEIADIKIAVILEQYMAYLERMKCMDMEIAGEFIVMASELMLIKSRMLLPKAEDPDEEDPRARLAAALLAYRQAKEASQYLEKQFGHYGSRYAKDEDEVPSDTKAVAPHDVLLLQKALIRLFSKKDQEAPPPMTNIAPIIKRKIVPVSEKIRDVVSTLSSGRSVAFDALFGEAESKSEIVAIFVALLALVKDGYVLLHGGDALLSEEDASGSVYDDSRVLYCSLNPESVVPDNYMSDGSAEFDRQGTSEEPAS